MKHGHYWHLDWLFPSQAQALGFIAHTEHIFDSGPTTLPWPKVDDQPIGLCTSGPITEREEEELAAVAVLYEGRILKRRWLYGPIMDPDEWRAMQRVLGRGAREASE